MEFLGRKDKKKKKKTMSTDLTVANILPNYNVESHYEERIAELKENNKVLSQALDGSYKTISLQDKTIADLRKRLATQVPKLLRVKLQIIGKTLKDLQDLWEDAVNLVMEEEADSDQQRPTDGNKCLQLSVANGSEEIVSAFVGGQQRHTSKKHKKRKAKNNSVVSSSSNTPSPIPSTSRTSNDANGTDLVQQQPIASLTQGKTSINRNKSSSSKNRSRALSNKKRKINEVGVMEQTSNDVPSFDESNDMFVATYSVIDDGQQVKKSKKNSKTRSRSAQRKVPSLRIKPLKVPKKTDAGRKKTKKKKTTTAAKLSSPLAIVKTEPVDNDSWKVQTTTRTIFSSSSDSSDTSIVDEPSSFLAYHVSSSSSPPSPLFIEKLSKRILPKVVLKDILKSSDGLDDPLVSRYKEKIVNDASFSQNGDMHNDTLWNSETEAVSRVDLPEQSSETNYLVEEASDSSDTDIENQTSQTRENFHFLDNFCIGDMESYPASEERVLTDEL